MSLERRAVTLHPYGECPDTLYGKECDGIGMWSTNPFSEEIYGIESWDWYCGGELHGLAMDI